MKRTVCLVAGLVCLAPLHASASADPETDTSAVAPEKNYNFPPNPFAASNQGPESGGPTPLNTSSWARQVQQNYPTEAVRAGQQGTVGLEVRVSKSGRVIECLVTKSSGYLLLDEAACEGMEKYSRFSAARNTEGESVEGSFRTSIVYAIN